MEALIKDENAMDKGVADTVKDHKRKHDDVKDDDDEDSPARPNQGKKTKRRRTKESTSSMKPSFTKETPKGKAPTKGSKTGKSASAKELVKEPIAEVVMDDAGDDIGSSNLQGLLLLTLNEKAQGPAFNLLKCTCSSSIKIEYNFQECFNALIDKLNWNNLEGDRYLFDLSKPLPLQGPSGHRIVAADYFFNNDLEYLKTSDPKVTYTSSITTTKAARYEIKGIEDMVPILWSTIKHAYDKDVEKGIKHWVKDVNCGTDLRDCDERSDQQLYKFKEGDFVDLHLNDIEDMHLHAVQHKQCHLDGSVIVDLYSWLLVCFKTPILKRTMSIEDYRLGIVYEDLDNKKRVFQADELYKFSDGTLKSVRDEIHYRVLDFHLDYNMEMPKRKWMAVD
ncbi:hypothetical protein Tco_0486512 [Tanacetum coccineum]